MESSNADWAEIKREADVDPSGQVIVKKVTLEKVNQRERKFVGLTIKELLELGFKLIGLIAIILSILQFQNQIEQQRKQDAKLKSDEISQADRVARESRKAESERIKADYLYRAEQLRLQEESNKQASQFNEQIATSLKISTDERIAQFQRDENEKKFKIYEPAVSEIELLLDDQTSSKAFDLRLKVFTSTTLPKIYLVSDEKLSTELDSLVHWLQLISDRQKYLDLLDSAVNRSAPFVEFLYPPETIKQQWTDDHPLLPLSNIGGRFSEKRQVLDSLDQAQQFLYEAFLTSPRGKSSDVTELREKMLSLQHVLTVIEFYVAGNFLANEDAENPSIDKGSVTLFRRQRRQLKETKYFISPLLDKAKIWKNRVRDSLRKQGKLLAD